MKLMNPFLLIFKTIDNHATSLLKNDSMMFYYFDTYIYLRCGSGSLVLRDFWLCLHGVFGYAGSVVFFLFVHVFFLDILSKVVLMHNGFTLKLLIFTDSHYLCSSWRVKLPVKNKLRNAAYNQIPTLNKAIIKKM